MTSPPAAPTPVPSDAGQGHALPPDDPVVRPAIERLVAENCRLRHDLTIGPRRYLLDAADADRLLDDLIASGGDERLLPYWADIWPSAVALAAWLADHADLVAGRPLLDLGCGLGLGGIAAATAGARPVFLADLHPEATAFALHNATLCGVGDACRPLPFDWSCDRLPEGVTWVVAADILFERGEHAPLERFLAALDADGAALLLADPLRTASVEFLDRPGVAARLRLRERRRVLLGDREHTIHLFANAVAEGRLAGRPPSP